MKNSIIICIVTTLISFNNFAQTDNIVDYAFRSEAMVLTNDAIKDIESKFFNEALVKIKSAITIDKTYHEAYKQAYQIGSKDHSKFNDAIEILKKGIAIYDDNDEFMFYLGEIYRLDNQLNLAIENFNKAIKLSKINGEEFFLIPYYYLNRASCFLKTDQFSLAIADYDYALNLKPDLISIYANRGIAYFKQKKKGLACSDWNRGKDLGNSSSKKYFLKYCNL